MATTAPPAPNSYLAGNFAPVREEVTATDLDVTGALPEYLDGRYLRNGPNPVTDPDPATYHWFMGTGMVHGLRLRDGRAEWYRNRYVRSADVAKALGEEPRPGPIHAGFDFSPNTNVIGHAGRTFAIVEAGGRPYELTDELDTVGPCDFDGTLPGGYTAHPLADPDTGELHAVSYFFGWANKVQYSVIGTDGRVKRTVDVEVSGSPMMHAFSLTDDHVIIYDLPVTFEAPANVPKPLRGAVTRMTSRFRMPERLAALALRSGGTGFPYGWNPDYPARVGVMRRDSDGSAVRWLDVEPCYVYHPLNAYDDGAERIVLDVARHPKMFDTDRLGPNEGPPTLDRWTVDLSAGKVIEERLDDRGQEFPRIDERLNGRRHRYGYAAAVGSEATGIDATSTLLKHDLAAGRTESRSFGPGSLVGEFVFVPSGPNAAEDDGVLMGLVHRDDRGRTDLEVLDASTLDTVATVHLPARVPYGFHGNWVPS
ncbi:MAG: carotenoid cleavage oxygenase [Actinomycetota bacterium]